MATFQQIGEKWRVQVRRKGHKPVSRNFARYEDGKKWADELEGRISGETYIDRSEVKGLRLRDLLERYRDEVLPGRPSEKSARYIIAAWLREPMADWAAIAVQPKDVAAWRKAREEAGKAPTTINNAVNTLSAVYRTAISEWGHPLTNPCQGIRRVKGRPAREAHLTPEQEAILLEECRRLGPTWLELMVILAVETGMRQGEIRKLEWSLIYSDHALLRVTKNGDPRRVPLPARARKALADRARQVVDVQPPPLGPFLVSKERVYQTFTAAVTAAVARGCPEITFHDLRHVGATRLADKLSQLELSRTLGHRGPAMTLRYYNPKASDLAAKIDGRHNTGLGVLEEFKAVVEKVRAAGFDPAALLTALEAAKHTESSHSHADGTVI